MTKPHLLNHKGMTLLEILVAITILSFISLGIITITQDAGEIKEGTVEEDREILQVEKAFYRFAFDFEQVYSPLFYSTPLSLTPSSNRRNLSDSQLEIKEAERALLAHYGQQDDFSAINERGEIIPRLYQDKETSFAFLTASNRRKYQNSHESTYAWVLYTIEDKDITDEFGEVQTRKAFVRYATADNPYMSPIWDRKDKLRGQILIPNIKELSFSFWDPDKKKYVQDLKTIKGGESLVRGVNIELTWLDRNQAPRQTTRFFKPSWPIFVPETDKEISDLQEKLRKYGKKVEKNKNK